MLFYLLLSASLAWAQSPTVTLHQATVTGTRNGSLDKFLGIPYAQPPYAHSQPIQFHFSS